MNRTIIFVSSFSIAIAAIMGWVRFKRIGPTYHPFLFLLWIGFLNEIVSTWLTTSNTALNTNIYYLAEGVLGVYFLRNQQKESSANLYTAWVLVFLVSWTVEVCLIQANREFVSYYIMVHSLVLTLLSIRQIEQEIGARRRQLTDNPVFLICAGFVVYFTLALVVEIIWKYNFFSRHFKANLQTVLSFVNIFTNLLYALAILWMPKKPAFSLSSSS